MSAKRDLEGALARKVARAGLPAPQRQYRFAARHVGMGRGIRKRLEEADLQDWRFDFAWPPEMLAVEVEGGIWIRGRHTRGAGFEGDCKKCNKALLLGWRVLRFTAGMIDSGLAIVDLAEALKSGGKDRG